MQTQKISITKKAYVGVVILAVVLVLSVGAWAQNIVAQVPVPSNACCQVALNKIYVSGRYSGGQDVFVIDGETFAGTDVGIGSTVSLDIKTDNYWAASVYGAKRAHSEGE